MNTNLLFEALSNYASYMHFTCFSFDNKRQNPYIMYRTTPKLNIRRR
jgi:hypothetical protein